MIQNRVLTQTLHGLKSLIFTSLSAAAEEAAEKPNTLSF